MKPSHFSTIVILAVLIAFTLESAAEKTLSNVSGHVVDTDGKPISGLELSIKPVEIGAGLSMGIVPRTPFSAWPRAVTDKSGHFSFRNIDSVSSQFVMFPEHGSDYEIVSMAIGDLTFYSTVYVREPPSYFGKLTFTVEPGGHLENVIVKMRPPRMGIRGRILLKDGTPLVNAEIGLTIRHRQRDIQFFIFSDIGGGSMSGTVTATDAEGYFVSYYPHEAGEYIVSVKYEGASAKSKWFRLKEGQRYDKLVLRLKDLEKHRANRNRRVKARQAMWTVNPDNHHAYKKIACDSWEDAKAKAVAEDAYIVAINDEAEQKWLAAVYPKKMFFWIGLRVPKKGAAWRWSNDEPFTYANWMPPQAPEPAGEVPVAMEPFSKRWIAIAPGSPFLSAVKYAILEKEDMPIGGTDATR